jgi:hypothetical protein
MKSVFTTLLLLIACFSFCQPTSKTNVILIGTYHFNNPGFDEGKVQERSILTKQNQDELEKITNKLVKKYSPSKVFVESDFAEREKLNAMYEKYTKGIPFYNADTLNAFFKRYYAENEIFQFGFRLAKKSKNDAIYSMDYDKVPIRFNQIKSNIEANPKLSFTDYTDKISALEKYMNSCISQPTLENVFKCLNSEQQYKLNKGLYISFLNKLTTDPDFFGADLVAAWYKRNLIMYANIQNQVTASDKNIVIILGAGHAAMMEEFIKNDPQFNLIKIDDVF